MVQKSNDIKMNGTKSLKKKDALVYAFKYHTWFSLKQEKYMTVGKLLKRSFMLCKSRFSSFNRLEIQNE